MDFDFEMAELAFARREPNTAAFERRLRARQLRALERIAVALEDLTDKRDRAEEDE